jgi:hypothetical protein
VLLDFVGSRNGAIVELPVDDTVIFVGRRFFEFYQRLAQRGVKNIGRPMSDIRRMPSRGMAISKANNDFRAAMTASHPASTARLRCAFITEYQGQSTVAMVQTSCLQQLRKFSKNTFALCLCRTETSCEVSSNLLMNAQYF